MYINVLHFKYIMYLNIISFFFCFQMSSFDKSERQMKNSDNNISIKIKEHIKHGHHRAKYTFTDDPVSLKL